VPRPVAAVEMVNVEPFSLSPSRCVPTRKTTAPSVPKSVNADADRN